MITKDGRDVSMDELTAENYLCPSGEEMCYHAVIEVKQYDPKTGRRISVPRLQVFGRKMWEGIVHNALRKQGYEIRVVHDPKEWAAQNEARLAQAEAERKAKSAEAAQVKKDAEKAALKAEIMAELRAAGLLGKVDKETKKSAGKKAENA